MRLISLSPRLFANMLAGHMLILVMIGLVFIITPWVLPLSVIVAAAIYLFEVAIVVTIQAFVFALLSAIYIGGAIEPEHWRLSGLLTAQTTDTGLADLGKAIAFGVGVGLGAVGAGIGIGNIFGSMIQAVARQPEPVAS